MGGNMSHEYHLPASIGDDTLVKCTECGYALNKEMLNDASLSPQSIATTTKCSQCQSGSPLQVTQGIEVGHTFLLGEKYSSLLGATVISDDGTIRPLTMGCYGIGITRLVAASVELLSTETDIRWPVPLAPFLVCLIPPKKGSREFERGEQIVDELYAELSKVPALRNNILVDDRSQLTIGKRMMMARRMGYPAVVVAGGAKCMDEEQPVVEVHLIDRAEARNVHPTDVTQELVASLVPH